VPFQAIQSAEQFLLHSRGRLCHTSRGALWAGTPGPTRTVAKGGCGHTKLTLTAIQQSQMLAAMSVLLLVASSNRGKLREFQEIAAEYGVKLEAVPNLKEIPEPEESGSTFEENAIIKAIAYSKHAPGQLVFADDSGLAVDALNGAPGVYSARYAASEGKKPSDSDNNYKLLGELAQIPNADRGAKFVCVIALAQDGKVIETFSGEARGEILLSPLGKGGFGYDPLFFFPAANKTFAEMGTEEKARYSHRGAAFRKLMEWVGTSRG